MIQGRSGVSRETGNRKTARSITDQEEVILLIVKKVFVEPEIVKYEQSLDKVTLNLSCYDASSWSGGRRKGKYKRKKH